MLRASDAQGFTLEWKSDELLTVETAYADLATVIHLFHRCPYPGDAEHRVHITFNEREPTPDELKQTRVRCHSAGAIDIKDPPQKRWN